MLKFTPRETLFFLFIYLLHKGEREFSYPFSDQSAIKFENYSFEVSIIDN